MKDKVSFLEEKNKDLGRLKSLLDDREVLTFENGRYVNEIREVIMTLISMNVSMNSVNDVIRVVLKKLSGLECGRLPTAEVIGF